MKGNMGIGAISDSDPQPLTVLSRQGDYAITTVGRINNKDEIVKELLKDRPSQFMSMSGGGINNTELVAALVSTGRDIVDGIRISTGEDRRVCNHAHTHERRTLCSKRQIRQNTSYNRA